nr:MAG TPA: hypothetical protein [Caudoviricetes sp.]
MLPSSTVMVEQFSSKVAVVIVGSPFGFQEGFFFPLPLKTMYVFHFEKSTRFSKKVKKIPGEKKKFPGILLAAACTRIRVQNLL